MKESTIELIWFILTYIPGVLWFIFGLAIIGTIISDDFRIFVNELFDNV